MKLIEDAKRRKSRDEIAARRLQHSLQMILLVGTLLCGIPLHAKPENVTSKDFVTLKETQTAQIDALRELHQVQLNALKEAQQAEAYALRRQMAAVDKRLDDLTAGIGQGTDRLSLYATVMGILITVSLAVLGLLGFITVTRSTKAQAEEAAKAWLEGHSRNLEARLEETLTKMDQITRDVLEYGEKTKQLYDAALKSATEKLQEGLGSNVSNAPVLDASAVALVRYRAEELRKTPEDRYSFDDWNISAHAAYANGKLEDAASFWLKALQMPGASDLDIARALFGRGLAQGKLLGQSEAAIASYDELLRRFGDASEAALREQISTALFNKGVKQGELDQWKKAIGTYDELLRRFADAVEPALREQVAKALFNKGVAQEQSGQLEAAIATYDELLLRFSDGSKAVQHESVAKALFNKGGVQGQIGKIKEAIATHSELVQRFGDASEAPLRVLVAKALINKGGRQAQLGQSDAAITTYDELVRRFGDASDLVFREHVALALNNKGGTLGQLGRREAAIATFNEVLQRFGDASEPELRQQVTVAHNGIEIARR